MKIEKKTEQNNLITTEANIGNEFASVQKVIIKSIKQM